MKKLKLISSLSALAVVGAATPIVATACNDDDDEQETKELTNVQYSDGTRIPWNMTLIEDGYMPFDPEDFSAECDGAKVAITSLFIRSSDETGEYIQLENSGSNWMVIPRQPTNNPIRLTFIVSDANGNTGYAMTNVSVISSDLKNVSYDGEVILPEMHTLQQGKVLTFYKDKFGATYLGQDVKITDVEIDSNDPQENFVKIDKDKETGNITVEGVKPTNGFVELLFTVKNAYGQEGYAVCSLKITSNLFTDVKYNGETLNGTEYSLVKTQEKVWQKSKFTATSPEGQPCVQPTKVEIDSSDKTKTYIELTENNNYYTCKAKEATNGFVELIFKLTFIDAEGKEHYGYASATVTVASNELTSITYGNRKATAVSLQEYVNGINPAEGDLISFDIDKFYASWGSYNNIVIDRVIVTTSDTEEEYISIGKNEEGITEVLAKKGMANGGYVSLNITVVGHRKAKPNISLVGQESVRLHIDYTWNTVGYKMVGNVLFVEQESLSGKTQTLPVGTIDETTDKVTNNNQTAKDTLTEWAAETEPVDHKLILNPSDSEYDFLEGTMLPKNVQIIGLMDSAGNVPTLKPTTIQLPTAATGEQYLYGNVEFAGVDFVQEITSGSTAVEKEGGTILISPEAKLNSLSFLGCGFKNTNLHIRSGNVGVEREVKTVVVNQCTFNTEKSVRDYQYENPVIGGEKYNYKWSSILLAGNIENVSITNNNFIGALYNGVAVQGKASETIQSIRVVDNAFYNIENRVIRLTANKNTSFDIRNNQIDGSCNLAPAQGGRETTDHWSEHIGQLFFAGSVEGSLISPTQFAKFLAIQRNNTFGTTEQKEMNFIYVPEAEGRPASEVGIVSFKPQ